MLIGPLEAFEEARALLLVGDDQADLDHAGARTDRFDLHVVDVVIPAVELVLISGEARGLAAERGGSRNEEVLVVRTVEDPDHARPRETRTDPPEEVVSAFFLRRGLESGEGDALRVDLAHDMTDDTALPRGVEPLDDEEHAVAALALRRGVEAFLKFGEVLGAGREGLLGGLAAAGPARGGVARDGRQVEVGPHCEGASRIEVPIAGGTGETGFGRSPRPRPLLLLLLPFLRPRVLGDRLRA